MSGTHESKRPRGEDARAQAEDWFVRIRSDDLTAEEFAAWENWLARDESHRHAFERVERIWAAIGQVRAIPWPSTAELRNDTYEADMPVEQWIADHSRLRPVARVADPIEDEPLDPLEGELLEEEVAAERSSRRGWFWTGAVAAGVAAAALTLWWRGEFLEPAPGPDYQIVTGIGEHHDITLPDGSRVVVGARSKLSVAFTARARNLHLDGGEAYFSVAQDEARPFVVQAGVGTITAIGTEFDVKQIGAKVAVTVVEGTVEVGAPPGRRNADDAATPRTDLARTKRVRAGERMEYDHLGFLRLAEAADEATAARTWWRDRNLRYKEQPLGEVIPDVQRYSEKRIVLADARAPRITFSGSVSQPGVQNWLERLGESLPVEVDTSDEHTIVIRAREP